MSVRNWETVLDFRTLVEFSPIPMLGKVCKWCIHNAKRLHCSYLLDLYYLHRYQAVLFFITPIYSLQPNVASGLSKVLVFFIGSFTRR